MKRVTLNYCCKTCGGLIHRQTALSGLGECKSCSRLGTKSWVRRNDKVLGCINCGKKISNSNWYSGNRRCRSCAKQGSLNSNFGNGVKISGKNNPCYGLRGEKHPAYKHGLSPIHPLIRHSIKGDNWIRKCLERDNFTCRDCGKTGHLVVHHLKPFAELLEEFIQEFGNLDKNILVELSHGYKPFWNLKNGITLCAACHKSRHQILREV